MTTEPDPSSPIPISLGRPVPSTGELYHKLRAKLLTVVGPIPSEPPSRPIPLEDEDDKVPQVAHVDEPMVPVEPRLVDAAQLTTPTSYKPETVIPSTIVNTPAVRHALGIMRRRYRLDDERPTADRREKQFRQGEPWHEPEVHLFRLLIATLGPVGSHWSTFTCIHGRSKDAIKRMLSNQGWLSSTVGADVLGDDTIADLTSSVLPQPTVEQWRASSKLPPLQVRDRNAP